VHVYTVKYRVLPGLTDPTHNHTQNAHTHNLV